MAQVVLPHVGSCLSPFAAPASKTGAHHKVSALLSTRQQVHVDSTECYSQKTHPAQICPQLFESTLDGMRCSIEGIRPDVIHLTTDMFSQAQTPNDTRNAVEFYALGDVKSRPDLI